MIAYSGMRVSPIYLTRLPGVRLSYDGESLPPSFPLCAVVVVQVAYPLTNNIVLD
jgi:hypothetical protein